MKVIKTNWYGFVHEAVAKKFEGNPQFVNDFCVNDEYSPVAVYFCASPNREKGHKDYLLLLRHENRVFVRGMDLKEIEKFRYQSALHCLNCDSVIYSTMRHDMNSCQCTDNTKIVSIDGGKDYTKVSHSEGSLYKSVVIDLLTDNVYDNLPKPSEASDEEKS